MKRYTTFDSNTELNGSTVLSFIININHQNIEKILKTRQLDNIDPEQWYPMQDVLDVFNDISETLNASANFVAIGVAAGEQGLQNLPPNVASMSIAEFFVFYEKVYQTRHRNGDAGYVKTEKVDDNHLIIRMKTPYPDDTMYGVFYAYARHFIPKNKHFTLQYDETLKRRENGGEETVCHLYIN